MPPEEGTTVVFAWCIFAPLLLLVVNLVNCGGKKDPKKDSSKTGKEANAAKPPKDSKQEKDPNEHAPEATGSKQKKPEEHEKKKKKKDKKLKSNAEGGGEADPFDDGGIDGDDAGAGAGDHTEGSQKASAKPKKKGGKGGNIPLPNKDGYDDLGPGAPPPEQPVDKSKMQNTDDVKSKMKPKEGGDDGYDNVDPTKNVDREDVNMENAPAAGKAAAGKKKAAQPPSSDPPPSKPNQPRKLPRDAKQQAIAKGAKKGKGDYPTFDDVLSDWDSKKEGKDKDKTTDKEKTSDNPA
uniref:Uncharacterized protein n=1 Tax=Panagrellus redivivus TaxID=6233 RepID=A0A7E4ZSQ9_PANRE